VIAVEVLDRCAPVAQAWDELADELGASPFLRPGWIERWWRAFGAGTLELVVARRHGRLVGVAPMWRHRSLLRTASNAHSLEAGFLAVDPTVERALSRTVLQRTTTRLSLVLADAHLPGLAACRAQARHAGMPVIETVLERSPWIDATASWDVYESGLSKNFRKDLARRRRRLSEAGHVELRTVDGTAGVDTAVQEFLAAESANWKGREGTAVACRPDTLAFYTDVARWAAERGWLRIRTLRLDDRPMAVEYVLTAGGTLHSLKSGYDEAFASYSPGMLLFHAIVRDAFEDPTVGRIDLGGADEPYKLRWASEVRERTLLQAFARSAPGYGILAASTHGPRLVAGARVCAHGVATRVRRTEVPT
jgi:CelD/BcsL family acetyltransferase involved in cellulose biosynthesis